MSLISMCGRLHSVTDINMSAIPRVWPTALKLGCVTNLDMLFLVMGFISLVDEI